MSDKYEYLKVAFLDTNTLHYIGLYLCYAKKNKLYPWTAGARTKDVDAAKDDVSNFAEDNLKLSLKRGLATVHVLLTHNLQVQYSPASELELLTGKTRGKAILSAAKEGIPDRMWTRFYEDEVRSRLNLADMKAISETVHRLSVTLEDSGVAVKANVQDRTQDALYLAKEINGVVYMEPMDSIIYASSIIAGADYFVTADGSLIRTINCIRDGDGNPSYERISKRLKKRVSGIHLESPDEVDLPRAFTVTPAGTLRPDVQLARGRGSS